MMGSPLKSLTIRGFKSIDVLDGFEPRQLNVLIGANGAGKSNFVDFFRMLRALADGNFQNFVGLQGGGAGFFYMGPKRTSKIAAHLKFGANVYEFDLAPTAGGGILIQEERVQFTGGHGLGNLNAISSGVSESVLKDKRNEAAHFGRGTGVPSYVYDAISSWTVYHFHDTSMLAPMRMPHSLRDDRRLRHDASNIAAFLFRLKEQESGSYGLIRDTVRLIAPFFDDFLLRPETKGSEEQIRLEWQQRGSDYPFQPSQLSDGTIRFICLATTLLQPRLPEAVVIDEPELGLHPYAITVLANLLQSAAERTQVFVCTQSPTLLDHFEADDIVAVNREAGRSTFERLDRDRLASWLEDYSMGELWQKNVVRGGPTRG